METTIKHNKSIVRKIMAYLQIDRWSQKVLQNLGRTLNIKIQSLQTNQIYQQICMKIYQAIKRHKYDLIYLGDNKQLNWIKEYKLENKLNDQYQSYYHFIKTIIKLYFLQLQSLKLTLARKNRLKNTDTNQTIMKMLKFQFNKRYLVINDIKLQSKKLTVVDNQILECCLCQVYEFSQVIARKIIKCKKCYNYFHPSCYRTTQQMASLCKYCHLKSVVNGKIKKIIFCMYLKQNMTQQSFQKQFQINQSTLINIRQKKYNVSVNCIQVKSNKQCWPRNYKIQLNTEKVVKDFSFPKQSKNSSVNRQMPNIQLHNMLKFGVKKISRNIWSLNETYPSYYLMGVFLTESTSQTNIITLPQEPTERSEVILV